MPHPNLTRNRLLTIAGIALVLSLGLLVKYAARPETATVSILGHALTSPAGTDSTLYMQMGESAFRSGDHLIYRQVFFAEHQKFLYPPSSLFLVEGLNFLRQMHVNADRVWLGLLIAGWAGTLAAGCLFYRMQRPQATALELTAVAVLGAVFLPLAQGLYRGQVQVLLTLFWGVSVLLWTARKPGWAGAALAVTCLFKPQLAIFLVWSAVRREWRFTAGFVATAGVALVASVAHFGVRNHQDYVAVLSYLSRHGEALWANQSMNGMMNRLLGNGDPYTWRPTVYPGYAPLVYAVGSAFTVFCVATGLLLPLRFEWAGSVADYVFFGCLSVLASPIAWEHHYGYFFFLFVLLLARAGRLSRMGWTLLVCGFLVVANRIQRLDFPRAGIQSLPGNYLFFGAILVLAVMAIEISRDDMRAGQGGSHVLEDEALYVSA